MAGGSVWFTASRLNPGERLEWSKAANRFQGSRAVGGRLALTDQRLVFASNRLDALLRGRRWAMPLEQIRSVGVEPRGGGNKSLFGGNLRNRLRIRSGDGEELFVINDLDDLLGRLAEAGLEPEAAADAGPVHPLRREP
ncbi:MAG: hypothetical protein ACRDLO_03275 [Solirubrobacterales bacterium]